MAFVKTEVQGAVEIITIDRPKALKCPESRSSGRPEGSF